MKLLTIILSVVIAINFVGCASTQNEVPKQEKAEEVVSDDATEITVYGEIIEADKEFKKKFIKIIKPQYTFTPKNKYVDVSKRTVNEVIFSRNKPSYTINFQKPMIITKINYVPDFDLFNDPINSTLSVALSPFALLGQALEPERPLTPAIETMSIYRERGKNRGYTGYQYNFNHDDGKNIVIKNPFGVTNVDKITVDIDKAFIPSYVFAEKNMKWAPGKFIIEAIEKKDIPNMVDYTLKTRHDKELNEKLISSILTKDKSLFKKLKKNYRAYNLPNISYFHLPDDVDLQYAKANKFRIFQNRVYRNKNGKYKAFKMENSGKVFDVDSSITINVKKLDVNENKTAFNKKDEKNTSTYIDFSEGI